MAQPTQRSELPPLRITAEDMQRLRATVERHVDGRLAATAEQLELELDRAVVVSQREIPPDVVTMRARVRVEEVQTGKQRELVLVYPEEADAAESKVSVLAPVGVAVLGLQVGSMVEWPLPNGRSTTLRIVEVLYQPEAAGDLHL